MRLAKYLQNLLDNEADQLDSQARARIEGAVRGLVRRASGPVAAWMLMWNPPVGRDGFVDWMQIDRRDSKMLIWAYFGIGLNLTVLQSGHK